MNLRFQPRSQESESKEFQDLKRDPAKRLTERPSEEGHKVDALVLGAEERRDKLRKAAGRSKYPMIRRCLNGETRLSKPQSLHDESIVMQGETR